MDTSSTPLVPKPVLTIVARELLRCCPQGKQAIQDAEQAIRRGHIQAMAGYTTYLKIDGTTQTAGRTVISDRLWQRIVAERQRDRFWRKGAVLLPSAGKDTGYELLSISLEPTSFIEHLDRYGLAVQVDPEGQIILPAGGRTITAAGRNAYAHGAPIAHLTLGLAGLSVEKLSAISALSLVDTLRQSYMALVAADGVGRVFKVKLALCLAALDGRALAGDPRLEGGQLVGVIDLPACLQAIDAIPDDQAHGIVAPLDHVPLVGDVRHVTQLTADRDVLPRPIGDEHAHRAQVEQRRQLAARRPGVQSLEQPKHLPRPAIRHHLVLLCVAARDAVHGDHVRRRRSQRSKPPCQGKADVGPLLGTDARLMRDVGSGPSQDRVLDVADQPARHGLARIDVRPVAGQAPAAGAALILASAHRQPDGLSVHEGVADVVKRQLGAVPPAPRAGMRRTGRRRHHLGRDVHVRDRGVHAGDAEAAQGE